MIYLHIFQVFIAGLVTDLAVTNFIRGNPWRLDAFVATWCLAAGAAGLLQ